MAPQPRRDAQLRVAVARGDVDVVDPVLEQDVQGAVGLVLRDAAQRRGAEDHPAGVVPGCAEGRPSDHRARACVRAAPATRSSAARHAASAPGVGRYTRTSWVLRSSARSSARPPDEHPAGAGLHQRVAERRRLDRAGQHRQPARVGGELAEQGVPRAAADDVHDLDVAAGQLGGAAARVRR